MLRPVIKPFDLRVLPVFDEVDGDGARGAARQNHVKGNTAVKAGVHQTSSESGGAEISWSPDNDPPYEALMYFSIDMFFGRVLLFSGFDTVLTIGASALDF